MPKTKRQDEVLKNKVLKTKCENKTLKIKCQNKAPRQSVKVKVKKCQGKGKVPHKSAAK